MSDDRSAEEQERDRKQREHIAKIKRNEALRERVRAVMLVYQALADRSESGSPEAAEFDRQWAKYMKVKKRLGSLTKKEEDEILEEYPRLVARLKDEHGL